MKDLDIPLNTTEKYLYGINVRLEILINQLSSIVEVIAKQQGVAIENNTVVQKMPKAKRINKE